MPLELLYKISQSPLPSTITDVADIDKLRGLRAAGHICVLLPHLTAKKPFARVLTLTKEGREALSHYNAAIS